MVVVEGKGKGTEGALSSGAGGLGASAAGGADFDVQGVDASLLVARGDVLHGEHGGIGRGLVTIGLDFHAACKSMCSGQGGEEGKRTHQ